MYHFQDRLPAVEGSATLSSEAAFHLPGASSRAQLLCHAASWRGSSSITVSHHATTHYSTGTPRTSIIAPNIPTVVASSGLSLTSSSCFFLFYVQAHLTPEHNRLIGKSGQGTPLVSPHSTEAAYTRHMKTMCSQPTFIYMQKTPICSLKRTTLAPVVNSKGNGISKFI